MGRSTSRIMSPDMISSKDMIEQLRNLDLDGVKSDIQGLTNQISDIVTNVKKYGAIGDGISDDTSKLVTADAVKGSSTIVNGNFLVKQNTTLNHLIFMNGGTITVDAGITLTITGGVECDKSTVCFKKKDVSQSFTATGGQTAFSLTGFNYVVGGNQLVVKVNGVVLTNAPSYTTYTETNSTTVTLATPCNAGDTVQIIKASRVVINNQVYSLGWFEGVSGDDKWNFLRRGLFKDVPYTCYITAPKINDPAYAGRLMWTANAPLYFDDPENAGKIIVECLGFQAMQPMKAILHFSPINKTEDIYFPNGIFLEGNSKADHCVYLNGGARIKFSGNLICHYPLLDGYFMENVTQPSDECEIDFFHCTGFGRMAYHIDAQQQCTFPKINFFFSNGAGVNTATNYMVIGGLMRGFHCDTFLEFVGLEFGLYDITDCVIKIQSNSYGALNNDAPTFVNILSLRSTKTAVKTIGTSSNNVQFHINKLTSNCSGTYCINIGAYTVNSYLGWLNQTTDGVIFIDPTCNTIKLNVNNKSQLASPMLAYKVWVNGKVYGTSSVNNNSAISLKLNNESGIVALTTTNANGYVILMYNNYNLTSPINAGSVINQTTGVLSGTTGTAGKLNVSFSGGYLYVENQTGATITVNLLSLTM